MAVYRFKKFVSEASGKMDPLTSRYYTGHAWMDKPGGEIYLWSHNYSTTTIQIKQTEHMVHMRMVVWRRFQHLFFSDTFEITVNELCLFLRKTGQQQQVADLVIAIIGATIYTTSMHNSKKVHISVILYLLVAP